MNKQAEVRLTKVIELCDEQLFIAKNKMSGLDKTFTLMFIALVAVSLWLSHLDHNVIAIATFVASIISAYVAVEIAFRNDCNANFIAKIEEIRLSAKEELNNPTEGTVTRSGELFLKIFVECTNHTRRLG